MASQRHIACKIPKDAKKITATKKETSSTVELNGMLMRSNQIKSKIPIPTERYKMAKDSEKQELLVPIRKKQHSMKQLKIDSGTSKTVEIGAEIPVGPEMTACVEMPIEGAEVAFVEMLVSVNENAKTVVGAETTKGIEDHVGVEMPVRRAELATVETQTEENLAEILIIDIRQSKTVEIDEEVSVSPGTSAFVEIAGSEVATDEVPVIDEMAICAEIAEGVAIDVGVKVKVPISAVVPAIAEVALAEVAIAEVAIAEVAIAEVAIAEVAIAEVAIAEVAIAEVAIAEVAIAEVAIAEVPSDDEVAIVEVPEGWKPKFAVDIDIEIKRLNTMLHEDTFFAENVKKFGRYENKDMHKAMKNVGTRILNDRFLSGFSYSGQRGKKKFKIYTKVTELIIFATMEACKTSTYEEVEKYFRTKYVKQAEQRI